MVWDIETLKKLNKQADEKYKESKQPKDIDFKIKMILDKHLTNKQAPYENN